MFFEPSKGHGLPRNPFKAIVAPRPIGWISTRALDGRLNLAPYSYFNAISSHPHLVMFSSEGEKDSVTFARESGEFVANRSHPMKCGEIGFGKRHGVAFHFDQRIAQLMVRAGVRAQHIHRKADKISRLAWL